MQNPYKFLAKRMYLKLGQTTRNVPYETCSFIAQEKTRLYQNRFDLLYQRIRRNRKFAPLNAVQVCLGVAGFHLLEVRAQWLAKGR